jgi:IS30 family transposase
MSGCKMHRYRYDAKIAQAKADKRLTQSRVGINMTAEDFETMVALVWPLIRNQGQSPRQIWLTYAEELPCSERSLYRYVEGCLGDMRRIHMPKAAAYKPRKRRVIRTSAELAGRNFADFCALDEEIRASAVEMDCVEGIISDSRCLMTLYLRPFKLLIMLMLPTQNRAHTASALDWLEKTIGKAAFQRHFSIILTDRGQEFLGFEELERSVDGSRRCHIYYCDAMRANQKGQIENAHRYIRRILPKGTSLDGISPLEVAHIASHINSAPRPSLGGASPFELACVRINNKTLEKLGLSLVHPDKVCLKPSLLEDLRRSDV